MSYEDGVDVYYSAASAYLRAGEGWEGTSGSENWDNYYILLEENDQPVVAVVAEYTATIRDFSGYQEDLFDLVKEKDVDEKTAEIMLERDNTLSGYYDYTFGYSDYKINITIHQKQNGSWADITKKTFPQDFGDKLKQFFPIYTAAPQNPSNLTMAPLKTPFMDGNKAIFGNWFTEEYRYVSIEPANKQILFKCGENAPAILEWNGEQLAYKKFPSTSINFEQSACTQIDFASGKNYTFKGKIGTEHDIQMDVKFSIAKAGDQPTVKMTGDYFYVGKGTKMPVEGEFSTQLGNSARFYRNKKGKKREEFAAFFIGCEMKGWWQHLERLDNIEEFTLKLVQ
ncbi:MAG: hypothetical protein GY810_06730 [Aureispira sp.]|nr:hypothetical protein [Aureispira sp.]